MKTEEENIDKKIEAVVENANDNNPEVNEEVKNEGNKADSKENEENNKTKKRNPILSAISITFRTVVWVALITAMLVLIATVVSRKTDVFGYRIYLIMSGSMEPTIHVKDAVITKQENEPKQGDVIAFEDGNIITVHRIVKVYTEGEKRLYQTKGDANNMIDQGLVQKTQVKGKVVFNSSIIGNTVFFLQHNFIVLILAIGIILIIIIIRRFI